jgi:hypothetical protein
VSGVWLYSSEVTRSDSPAPHCEVSGARSSDLAHPDGWECWAVAAEFADGGTLTWGADHGDEVIFVAEGSLDTPDGTCEREGVVLVDAGVPATITAAAGTRILHWGSMSVEPPADGPIGPAVREGRSLHVIGSEGRFAREQGAVVAQKYFVDATQPTSRISLLLASADDAYTSVSHLHSEDEIMYVRSGELRVGRDVAPQGSFIAIKGDYRYRFQAPAAFSFLNFRRDVSTVVVGTQEPPHLEICEVMGVPAVATA